MENLKMYLCVCLLVGIDSVDTCDLWVYNVWEAFRLRAGNVIHPVLWLVKAGLPTYLTQKYCLRLSQKSRRGIAVANRNRRQTINFLDTEFFY